MNISENEKFDGLIICIDIHMQGHNNTDQIAFHVKSLFTSWNSYVSTRFNYHYFMLANAYFYQLSTWVK